MTRILHKARGLLLTPALTLLVCLLAYGSQIPWVGFYLDDWIILNAYSLGGAPRVFEYAFLGNRPLVAWIWILGFKLFGMVPLYWQIWALFWRWMTVVIFWLGWRELWPKAQRQLTLAALLFAVYPLFRQQGSALTYSFHWICFFLSGLSLYLLILAIRHPRRFVPLMLGSLLAGIIQIFSQEFFIGVLLLTPVVIWLALRPVLPEWKARLKRAVLILSPYLMVMAGYLVWRITLMPTAGEDRNTPVMLKGLLTSPLSVLSKLASMLLQDMAEIFQGVWYKSSQPDLFVFTPFSNLAAWGIAVFTAVLVLVVLWRVRSVPAPESGETASPWYASAIPYGLIAMLLGFAPGWAIGRHIYDLTGIYNDRFGLAATFGVAIFLVALFDALLKKPAYHLLLVCLLIGLGAGQNVRFMGSFRYSWEKQRQLFWQLKWRAPGIKAPTAIISDGALISYMGSWATSSALVQMYAPDKDTHKVDYWFFETGDLNLESLVSSRGKLSDKREFLRYESSARDSLVISYAPENLQCLWVLSERDVSNRSITPPLRAALPVSNLDQILRQPDLPMQTDIFGPEPAHDWCYYYQKGDLGVQYQDWASVVNLWNTAQKNGKHPRSSVEYLPFIQGFAHTGDWQTAIELTRKAYFPKYEMRDMICQTWQQIVQTTPDTPARHEAIPQVIDNFECRDELGN